MNNPQQPIEPLPISIQDMIQHMMDDHTQDFAKTNYRNRLLDIRDQINDAINTYDASRLGKGRVVRRKGANG